MTYYNIDKEIYINASASEVWSALTEPPKIAQYLFGTKVTSDWKIGSEIIYEGSFNGIDFKDTGVIVEIEEHRLFKYSYWSKNHGTENKIENHVIISYILEQPDSGILLKVKQEKYQNKEIAEGMKQIWDVILNNFKEFVEQN